MKKGELEIRGFLQLHSLFKKKFGHVPFTFEIDTPISGRELADRLGIEKDEVEVVFVNGFAQNIDYVIDVGSRVAFLPPGCPGPYRIALGFYAKNSKDTTN